MNIALAAAVCVLTTALGALTWLLLVTRSKLARFSDIADIESYKESCRAEAEQAQRSAEQCRVDHEEKLNQINSLKKEVSQYQQVVADFKSVAELKRHIKQLRQFADGCTTLGELHAKIEHQTALKEQLGADAQILGFAVTDAKSAGDISDQIAQKQSELARLKAEVMLVEESRDLQEFGFYQRRYDFDSSERYKQRLDEVRGKQKVMIKSKTAATCDTEWTVQGSAAKGKKMVNDKIKLLLRAFNGEADAAVAKVKYNNATSMEGRINRSFEQINKMGVVNQVHISRGYLDLKLQELYLEHEYAEIKQEEKESQKAIKQQMAEEAKAEKEIKKAQEEAEREEAAKKDALEKARAELKATEGKQTDKLAQLVSKLELELQEALDRKAKAIARAQLTRSGHVYILSNIGSFGEGIYKIGMTRRLEPLERVKELGSASVPFTFDVHAMIYSEDAPALENALHKYFDSRRVNVVNGRKEFFRVSLEEIREAVAENFGEVTFVTVAEAAEYRQSVAKLAQVGPDDHELEPDLVAG